MDFTRPVDPALTKEDFAGKTVADAIDLYKGSGGGTAFDLADLADLPADPITGRKWARYVKVTANITGKYGLVFEGETDAFARVRHQIDPVSIGEAKKLPDGARVILKPAVVSAATWELGPYCYIQHADNCAGIRLMGRVLMRGETVTVYGDMDTVDGERVVVATGIEKGEPITAEAVAMAAPAVGGGDYFYQPGPPVSGQKGIAGASGLNNIGLLVRTCGKVLSIDTADRTFVIDGGSGAGLECAAPADGPFDLPQEGTFVSVTGISSCRTDGQGGLVPVLRIRDVDDLRAVGGH